jgi:hypothetical protein
MKLIAVAILVAPLVFGIAQLRAQTAPPSPNLAPVANSKGDLRVPADYRELYQYLGTWAVAAEGGPGSKQLHVVYASPGAVDFHRRNGRFPDGAVLVKEVFDTSTSAMTTGTVSRTDSLKGWFVMVKDGGNSHPENKLWGDGWGWSWFDAGAPTKTTTTDYKTECLGCHLPAQSTDWTYVEGYAVLRK